LNENFEIVQNVNFSDHTRPVESFSMKDLLNLQIAYQPPTAAFDAVKEFTFKAIAVDDYFAESSLWILSRPLKF